VSTLSFGDTGLLVYVTGLEGYWPQIKRGVTDGERQQAKGDFREKTPLRQIPQQVNPPMLVSKR